MPLWDSVQRGLEKASQEAARIAKTQRLRSTIDGLIRQLNAQNSAIFNKTMELFLAGQLTQSELLPLCQEMVSLQQQLNQAQNELKQLQASQPQPTGPTTGVPNPYLPPGTHEGIGPTAYAPPPPGYQSYLDSTQGASVPPPPPGMEALTVSQIETIHMGLGTSTSAPQLEKRRCSVCQAEVAPNNAFCHNCGAPVQDSGAEHLPTMRAGTLEHIYPRGPSDQPTIRTDAPPPPPVAFTTTEPIRASSDKDDEANKNEGA